MRFLLLLSIAEIPQSICQIFVEFLNQFRSSVSVFIFLCIQFRCFFSKTTQNDDPPIANLEKSIKEDTSSMLVIIFKLPAHMTHENLIYCESNLSFLFGSVENILRGKFGKLSDFTIKFNAPMYWLVMTPMYWNWIFIFLLIHTYLKLHFDWWFPFDSKEKNFIAC